MFLLRDYIMKGEDLDWVLWIDSDAMILNHNQDIRSYFVWPYAQKALVAQSGNPRNNAWDINDGVMFLNMRHPMLPRMIEAWYKAVMGDSGANVSAPNQLRAHQSALHDVLRTMAGEDSCFIAPVLDWAPHLQHFLTEGKTPEVQQKEIGAAHARVVSKYYQN